MYPNNPRVGFYVIGNGEYYYNACGPNTVESIVSAGIHKRESHDAKNVK
jgi:hypothetical protein